MATLAEKKVTFYERIAERQGGLNPSQYQNYQGSLSELNQAQQKEKDKAFEEQTNISTYAGPAISTPSGQLTFKDEQQRVSYIQQYERELARNPRITGGLSTPEGPEFSVIDKPLGTPSSQLQPTLKEQLITKGQGSVRAIEPGQPLFSISERLGKGQPLSEKYARAKQYIGDIGFSLTGRTRRDESGRLQPLRFTKEEAASRVGGGIERVGFFAVAPGYSTIYETGIFATSGKRSALERKQVPDDRPLIQKTLYPFASSGGLTSKEKLIKFASNPLVIGAAVWGVGVLAKKGLPYIAEASIKEGKAISYPSKVVKESDLFYAEVTPSSNIVKQEARSVTQTSTISGYETPRNIELKLFPKLKGADKRIINIKVDPIVGTSSNLQRSANKIYSMDTGTVVVKTKPISITGEYDIKYGNLNVGGLEIPRLTKPSSRLIESGRIDLAKPAKYSTFLETEKEGILKSKAITKQEIKLKQAVEYGKRKGQEFRFNIRPKETFLREIKPKADINQEGGLQPKYGYISTGIERNLGIKPLKLGKTRDYGYIYEEEAGEIIVKRTPKPDKSITKLTSLETEYGQVGKQQTGQLKDLAIQRNKALNRLNAPKIEMGGNQVYDRTYQDKLTGSFEKKGRTIFYNINEQGTTLSYQKGNYIYKNVIPPSQEIYTGRNAIISGGRTAVGFEPKDYRYATFNVGNIKERLKLKTDIITRQPQIKEKINIPVLRTDNKIRQGYLPVQTQLQSQIQLQTDLTSQQQITPQLTGTAQQFRTPQMQIQVPRTPTITEGFGRYPPFIIPKLPIFGAIGEGYLQRGGGGRQANRYQASLVGLLSGKKQSKAAQSLTGLEVRYPVGISERLPGTKRKTRPLYSLQKGKSNQVIKGIEKQLLYKTRRRG